MYYYFNKYQQTGIWAGAAPKTSMMGYGRWYVVKKETPSAAIVDSQNVKTTFLGSQRDIDVAKHVKGRKRHLIVDTLGLMLSVVVLKAGIDE